MAINEPTGRSRQVSGPSCYVLPAVAAEAHTIPVVYQGRAYACQLIPSPRNRHVRIRILPQAAACDLAGPTAVRPSAPAAQATGLTLPGVFTPSPFAVAVSFPPRLNRTRILQTIVKFLPWIARQADEFHRRAIPLSRRALVTGAQLPLAGRPLTLTIFPATHAQARVQVEGRYLVCRTRHPGRPDLRRLLERWYRAQTETLVRERLAELAPRIGRRSYRVRVREQKSRWGSCSAKGTLCFNWKLSMMPKTVCDYILLHELAHLVELNHSERFWKMVHQSGADVAGAKAWLAEHSAELDW